MGNANVTATQKTGRDAANGHNKAHDASVNHVAPTGRVEPSACLQGTTKVKSSMLITELDDGGDVGVLSMTPRGSPLMPPLPLHVVPREPAASLQPAPSPRAASMPPGVFHTPVDSVGDLTRSQSVMSGGDSGPSGGEPSDRVASTGGVLKTQSSMLITELDDIADERVLTTPETAPVMPPLPVPLVRRDFAELPPPELSPRGSSPPGVVHTPVDSVGDLTRGPSGTSVGQPADPVVSTGAALKKQSSLLITELDDNADVGTLRMTPRAAPAMTSLPLVPHAPIIPPPASSAPAPRASSAPSPHTSSTPSPRVSSIPPGVVHTRVAPLRDLARTRIVLPVAGQTHTVCATPDIVCAAPAPAVLAAALLAPSCSTPHESPSSTRTASPRSPTAPPAEAPKRTATGIMRQLPSHRMQLHSSTQHSLTTPPPVPTPGQEDPPAAADPLHPIALELSEASTRESSERRVLPAVLSRNISSAELLMSIANNIAMEVRSDIYARRTPRKQLSNPTGLTGKSKEGRGRPDGAATPELLRRGTSASSCPSAPPPFVSWADAGAPHPSEALFVSWAEPSWATAPLDRRSSVAGEEACSPQGGGAETASPTRSTSRSVLSGMFTAFEQGMQERYRQNRLRRASHLEARALRDASRLSKKHQSARFTAILDRRRSSSRAILPLVDSKETGGERDQPLLKLPAMRMRSQSTSPRSFLGRQDSNLDESSTGAEALQQLLLGAEALGPVISEPEAPPSIVKGHIKLRDMARAAIIKPRQHLSMKRSYNDMKIRRIRIFLSSTFADMQDERQLIMTTQVPQLRRACLENGIHVTVVDLRLGVTEGDMLEKRTLGICLDLVASSEYFVNFLGERYGWVPRVDDVDAKTLHDHPWIEPYLGKTSATEFEVLAGALGWGAGSKLHTQHAFFYARDPKYIETLPASQQADFLETNEKSEKSLVALKDSIRRRAEGEPWPGQQLPTLAANRTYSGPVELASMFFTDIFTQIQNNSPWKKRTPTPLMAEYVQHISHAWGLDIAYVGQISVQSAIENYVKGEGRRGIPLVLVGERASGKSAAVAHWLLNNRAPGFVLPHFVGCFYNSADHIWIMRRIMLELKVAFDLSGDVPLDSQELQDMLPGWLQRVCRGRTETVTILIDGVDQLADPAARSLQWLPLRVPPNCNIILTTLDDDLRSCKLRGWVNIVQLPPNNSKALSQSQLQDAYKGLFIRSYMKHYGKNIDASVVSMIERAGGSYNPLFLRLCLDELMMQANYATVKDVAKELVSCATLPELCQLILMRFENVFGEPLVSTALQCICMSRYGLSEEELLLLLQMLLPSSNGSSMRRSSRRSSSPLRRAKVNPTFTTFGSGVIGKWQRAIQGGQLPWLSWAPFYKAALGLLSTNGGLVDISCVSFRHAAMERYLGDEEDIMDIHCALAHFFSTADPNVVGHSRLCEELPYQLLRAGQTDALEAFCLDMHHFEQMWNRRRYDVYTYWRRVGNGKLPEDIGVQYCDAVARQAGDWWQKSRSDLLDPGVRERTERIATTCGMISEFLSSISHFREAAQMQRHSLQVTQLLYHKDNRRIARELCRLAHTENMYGLHKQALTKLEQAIGLLVLAESEEKKKNSDRGSTQASERSERSSNRASQRHSQHDKTLESVQEECGSDRADPTELPKVHVESAMVHHLLSHTKQAVLICEASLKKCISAVGDTHLQVADVHGKLGSLYMSMGSKADVEKGKAHLNQAIEISGNKLAENDHTAAEAMATLGQLLLVEGQHEKAVKFLELSLRMTHSIFGTSSVHFASVMESLALGRIGMREEEKERKERQAHAATGEIARRPSDLALSPASDTEDAPSSDERARFAAELAAATVERKMTEGFEPVNNELLEMEPLQMFEFVLRIRHSRQGDFHVDVAYSYIHQADAYWVEQDYEKVIELYELASEILTEVLGPDSKQIAQLQGWSGIAFTCMGKFEQALDKIARAMLLVDKAFEVRTANGTVTRRGNRSWEYWRLKHDLINVLKHAAEIGAMNKNEPKAAQQRSLIRMTSLGSNVHASFSDAEREEVQAKELRKELIRDSVRDEAPKLSVVVPKLRDKLRRRRKQEQRGHTTHSAASAKGKGETSPAGERSSKAHSSASERSKGQSSPSERASRAHFSASERASKANGTSSRAQGLVSERLSTRAHQENSSNRPVPASPSRNTTPPKPRGGIHFEIAKVSPKKLVPSFMRPTAASSTSTKAS